MEERATTRTTDDELRILRRTVRSDNRKRVKKESVRIEGRLNGMKTSGTVTLQLLEIPQPETSFANDVSELVNMAIRHAHERCERLGYKRVLGVHYDGKVWTAKLELQGGKQL